jgi:transposase
MNNHPPAVVEKAQRLAELLDRVERGEPSEQAGQELGLTIVPGHLIGLRQKYQASGGDWQVLLDGRYGHEQKASDEIKEWLYARKQAEPGLTGPQLVEEIKSKFGVEFSAGHINYLLRKVALTRPPGRPQVRPKAKEPAAPTETVSLPNAGLFFPGGGERGDGVDQTHRNVPEPGQCQLSNGPPQQSAAPVEQSSRDDLEQN